MRVLEGGVVAWGHEDICEDVPDKIAGMEEAEKFVTEEEKFVDKFAE